METIVQARSLAGKPDNAKYIGKGYAKTKIEKDENGKDVETLDCDIKYDPDCPIGFNPFAQEVVWVNTFHREPAEPAPTVYSTKHWRNGRGTHWSGDQWLPDHIYMKRLPQRDAGLCGMLFQNRRGS